MKMNVRLIPPKLASTPAGGGYEPSQQAAVPGLDRVRQYQAKNPRHDRGDRRQQDAVLEPEAIGPLGDRVQVGKGELARLAAEGKFDDRQGRDPEAEKGVDDKRCHGERRPDATKQAPQKGLLREAAASGPGH